jgi:hypothetical protein
MWATGRYEKVNHSTRKRSTAENFMRSAKAPTMRAGVIAAKVSWNTTKASSGITTPWLKVSTAESGLTPARNIFESPPTKGVSAVASSAVAAPVKASE